MISNDNYGFSGPVPDGVSVADNVSRALDYQANHSIAETIDWFYETVRKNKDGHLSADLSMDYKQINPQYADFGNFNYAVVGKAIGFPDWVEPLAKIPTDKCCAAPLASLKPFFAGGT